MIHTAENRSYLYEEHKGRERKRSLTLGLKGRPCCGKKLRNFSLIGGRRRVSEDDDYADSTGLALTVTVNKDEH